MTGLWLVAKVLPQTQSEVEDKTHMTDYSWCWLSKAMIMDLVMMPRFSGSTCE